MAIHYIDGEFVEASQARIPADDLAVLRGYGVFDFLRTYKGAPFRLVEHLQRLRRSAQLIELACPWDIAELADIVEQTLRHNNYSESGIRLVITGGEGHGGFLPTGKSRLLVMVAPMLPLPAETIQRGASVVAVEQARHLPEAKTINYIPGITAQLKARRANPQALEAIYTEAGKVREGTRSNTFICRGGIWSSPARGVLPGITRAEVIRLLGDQVDLRDITLDEYRAADEVIITSSTKEIVPIVRVDDCVIGNGAPGPCTSALLRKWRELTLG
ncbi:MAG: aminotransferase class IV [Chloroflexi bacterium]|nr:aminotransferase class IV [Chloroflexota bacterium]MCY4248653.1 aminotransferase class IV [Chloroflexota bacterium]